MPIRVCARAFSACFTFSSTTLTALEFKIQIHFVKMSVKATLCSAREIPFVFAVVLTMWGPTQVTIGDVGRSGFPFSKGIGGKDKMNNAGLEKRCSLAS